MQFVARCRRGFTLIEVLMAAALLALVIGVISISFVDTLTTSSIARVRLRVQQDIRDTLGYVSRMIRYAGVRPVDVAVEEIGDDYMVFQGDYDADGAANRFSFVYDSASKTITVSHWEKSGANFYLVNDPEVVMMNVEELLFTYYTKDNTVTVDPDEVTAVRIQVTISPPDTEREAIRQAVGNLSSSQLVFCPNLSWRLAAS